MIWNYNLQPNSNTQIEKNAEYPEKSAAKYFQKGKCAYFQTNDMGFAFFCRKNHAVKHYANCK